ncbi:MAG TPA: sulfatase-like hydrolase/transferase [Acidimicrobiales bacterium]|nr:sulfatase-like hydrolase/transferase [Acidimicrobiales bacterium]
MVATEPSPDSTLGRLRLRIGFGRLVRESLLPIVAVSGLAIAQPLLDLFGSNAEFFVAAQLSKTEIAVFALAAVVVVPAVLFGLVLLVAAVAGQKPAEMLTHVLVGVLAFVLGMTAARQFGADSTVLPLLVALGVAGTVTFFRLRSSGFRQAIRYLSAAPVFFLALFFFGSPTSDLLFSAEASVAAGVTIENPAPIVFIVADELPMASLLRPDGTINAERFPNMARLASNSTLYRNTTSVSPNTPLSVPTILDGKFPPDHGLPTSADHPENLFTMLGASYDMSVTEAVTDLCPGENCEDPFAAVPESPSSRLSDALSDAAVVYGHASLPRRFRNDLPAVDQSWGDFIDTEPDVLDPGAEPTTVNPPPSGETTREFMARVREENRAGRPTLQGETLRQALGTPPTGDHELLFVHEVFPHFPWTRTPSGAVYDSRGGPPGLLEDYGWNDDFLMVQAQQRHLLQLGYLDRIVGELIDTMTAEGTWDDALVVLTADHGIAFNPDDFSRAPTATNIQEVYRVPLFIKAPDQTRGAIDDDLARTIDIVPTIVDLLGVDTEFVFDGVSLESDERADTQSIVYPNGPREVGGGTPDVLALAERNQFRFPTGDDWRAVVAVGPYGGLVGTPVADLAPATGAPVGWTVNDDGALASVDLDSGAIPILLTCSLSGAPDSGELLVALNGVVAGAVGREGDEGCSFLVDETLFVQGPNTVELLAVDGDPLDPQVVVLATAS